MPIIPLSSVLFCVSGITTSNGTVSTSDVLGYYLALCGTIIYIFNFSPGSPLTKALLLVIIESLIIFRNGHENMVLHANNYPRAKETVTGCAFTTKGTL